MDSTSASADDADAKRAFVQRRVMMQRIGNLLRKWLTHNAYMINSNVYIYIIFVLHELKKKFKNMIMAMCHVQDIEKKMPFILYGAIEFFLLSFHESDFLLFFFVFLLA